MAELLECAAFFPGGTIVGLVGAADRITGISGIRVVSTGGRLQPVSVHGSGVECRHDVACFATTQSFVASFVSGQFRDGSTAIRESALGVDSMCFGCRNDRNDSLRRTGTDDWPTESLVARGCLF